MRVSVALLVLFLVGLFALGDAGTNYAQSSSRFVLCSAELTPGDSIQSAINEADSGAIICLGPGEYNTNVRVTKKVIIQGAGVDATILRPVSLDDPVFTIDNISSSVGFRDFSIGMGDDIEFCSLLSSGISTFSGCNGGIVAIGQVNTFLRNIEISGVDTALGFIGSTNPFGVSNVRLDNVTASGNTYGVEVIGGVDLTIVGSNLNLNRYGMSTRIGSCSRTDNCFPKIQVSSSDFSANSLDGIQVLDQAVIQLNRSTVNENGRHGIFIGTNSFLTGSATGVIGQITLNNSEFVGNAGGCGIIAEYFIMFQGVDNAVSGNSADYCGYAPIEFRTPLQDETTETLFSVPGDFATIQEAIDAVAPGGVVELEDGVHTGQVMITKPMTLRGSSPDNVFLSGNHNSAEVGIRVSIVAGVGDVAIEGITFEHFPSRIGVLNYADLDISNVVMRDSRFGIGILSQSFGNLVVSDAEMFDIGDGVVILDAEDVFAEITDSYFHDINGDGVVSGTIIDGGGQIEMNVSNSRFEGMTITGVTYDVFCFTFSSAIQCDQFGSVTNSEFIENGWHGIEAFDAHDLVIDSVFMDNNGQSFICGILILPCSGIVLWGDTSVVIRDSEIRRSAEWGVYAHIQRCGASFDSLTGTVEFEGENIFVGNDRLGNNRGAGNPGNHPFTDLPSGQVCVP